MLILAIFTLMTAVALLAEKITRLQLTRVRAIALLYTAALSYNGTYIQALGSGIGLYNGLFDVTRLSQFMDTFIVLVGAVILCVYAPLTDKVLLRGRTQSVFTAVPTISAYPLILLFTTCGASFLISSGDLVSMYLSIELQSFALYILAAIYRDSEGATASGLKYFLLGGLSSGLILLGSALVYSCTGLTDFESIFSLLTYGDVRDNSTNGLWPCYIGIVITMMAFLFKIASAPFHNRFPDIYDGTPTIVTTWLTIMPKLSILVLLLVLGSGLEFNSVGSLTYVFNGISFDVWKNVLLVCSLLSLLVGTVVGLSQYRIKRLFAYSRISHVGFLLLALRVSSEESIESYLFYVVQYTLTNLNAFLVLLAFGYSLKLAKKSSDIQYISELKGQFEAYPLLRLSLTLSLFSMAGVPPLMGFFGKQMVLYSATLNGYYFMAIVGVVVSVISAVYYLKIIQYIYFETPDTGNEAPRVERGESRLTNVHSFAIATLTMMITFYLFNPTLMLDSMSLLALSLFNS